MTFPLNLSDEPGESEFSHGKGLMASAAQRRQSSSALEAATVPLGDPEGPWQPSVYEQGKAVQRTDPAKNSNADYAAEPYSDNNTTGTQWERE